jgi:hypothetical protein
VAASVRNATTLPDIVKLTGLSSAGCYRPIVVIEQTPEGGTLPKAVQPADPRTVWRLIDTVAIVAVRDAVHEQPDAMRHCMHIDHYEFPRSGESSC